MSYRSIVRVEPLHEHQLRIYFDNGECRLFDATPLLGVGRFSELRESSVFEKVRVSFDTVEWENGLDLDPEYVYENSMTCAPGATTDHAKESIVPQTLK
jgi:Protein of unknown function (DUF2442)